MKLILCYNVHSMTWKKHEKQNVKNIFHWRKLVCLSGCLMKYYQVGMIKTSEPRNQFYSDILNDKMQKVFYIHMTVRNHL